MSEHWNTWLQTSQVPPDQLQELADTLSSWGIQAKTKNGHNTTTATLKESDEGVTIVRQSADDLLITDCPPYEDVMGLLPLYERLAFRENLLLKGPKGTGKTLSQLFFASGITAPVVVLECSEDTKNRNLIGSFYLKGRETPYILGAMPTAIDIANEVGHCIIAFEEINALTPQVQKELNALLDFRTMVSIPQIGKTYKLKEGAALWAVATMNPSVYGGTYDLNEDLRSRWDEVEIGYPPPGAEKRIVMANVENDGGCTNEEFSKRIDMCIRLAGESRQTNTSYALSSRDVVRMMRDTQVLGVEAAMQLVACKFEGDDRKTIIKRISSIFPKIYPKNSWGASK